MLATASVATLLCAMPLSAQESGLRGAITTTDDPLGIRKPTKVPLTAGPDAQSAQASDYQPVSPGAVPDDAGTNNSLFSEPPNADDAINDATAPMRPLPPTTARQRTEEARRKLATPVTAVPSQRAAPAEPDDMTTATVRQGTVDSETPRENGPEVERQIAIEGREPVLDENPFAPIGIRFGNFILKPSLEQGIVATSNADSSFEGKSAVLSETTLRLNAVSDWQEHSATIDAYGNFHKTLSGEDVKDTEGGIAGQLELDLSEDLRAIGTLGYVVRPESATSPVVISGTASQPLRHTLDGSLAVEKDVGDVRLGVAGTITHDSFGDADLSDGGTLSQKDRNSTLYTGRLRAGYEISPALTPFGEVEFGRRIYELRYDTAGFERSSNMVGARAGLALDMGEKFGGEVSAGWVSQKFDDDRLGTVSSPTVAANFRWSPMRGTLVNLNALTTLEGSTSPGESGSVLYAGQLSIERQLRANLTGNIALGAGWRDYADTDDHELGLTAEAGLTWWLNRYAGLTGRLRHETFNSTLQYRDSKTNSVFVGLKVQR